MVYEKLAESVNGLTEEELWKIFGVNNHPAFNREYLRFSSQIGVFGLMLRIIGGKFYLVALTEKPPDDLSKPLLLTLSHIYKLLFSGYKVSIKLLGEFSKIPGDIIKKQMKKLKERDYIFIKNSQINLTEKCKKTILFDDRR